MAYYIYRNWVAEKKAVIHRADCGYCNNGRGFHKNPMGDKNGRWFGPYSTIEEALSEAIKTYKGMKLELKRCKRCNQKGESKIRIEALQIPTPSIEQVDIYLKKWDSLENYVLQESSLRKLFTQIYPYNVEMDDILIKVCSLNDFYSTNIFSPFIVAKHIANLSIDKRLAKNDFALVNEIALVPINGTKKRNFYSFATKYCSHHKPEEYPIFDNFVEKMLMYFKGQDGFLRFKKKDMRDYPKYREILIQYSKFYGLERFTLKQIDKYLWQAGKKYFTI